MTNESVHSPMDVVRKFILIFFGAVLILVVLWLGVPTYQKEKADSIVRERCAKDGGLKVYEKVFLPESRFSNSGMPTFPRSGVLPPLKENAKPDDDFFFAWQKTWIWPESDWAPAIWRDDQQLFRRSDGKMLGQAIGYSRRGGDPVGPWHPSSFGCPSDADITVLVQRVFFARKQ